MIILANLIWAYSDFVYLTAYKDTMIFRAYDYYILKKDDGVSSLKIYYEIPHGKLFYHKENNAFINRHTIVARLYQKRQLITEKAFTKSTQVPTYEQTLSYNETHIDSIMLNFPTLELKNANLNCQVELTDQVASKTYKYVLPIKISSFDIYLNLFKNRRINPSQTYQKSTLATETLGVKIYLTPTNISGCSLIIYSEDLKK
ncbi:MAG: hypothetical protein RMJ65_03650, partial [candidate division WOR-3 bacterium]|nr:hypothetical protein [candidate division WOR-3 bacterium]